MHKATAVKKEASSSVHIKRAPGFLLREGQTLFGNVFAALLLLAEVKGICTKHLEYEKP